MDGSKKVDYFNKAFVLELIPVIGNIYSVDEHSFYHDVSNISPIVGHAHGSQNYGDCLIINRNKFRYDRVQTHEDQVQRACRNLILKYNLKNL